MEMYLGDWVSPQLVPKVHKHMVDMRLIEKEPLIVDPAHLVADEDTGGIRVVETVYPLESDES